MSKALIKLHHLQRLAGAALLLLLLAPTAQAAATETRTTAYVYDSKGQVLRELIESQDSAGLVTEYSYDAHGKRTRTQPRNCNGSSPIPGVGTEAAKPTGSAVFTTGAVQLRYDYPCVNGATERKITTTNALGHQGVEERWGAWSPGWSLYTTASAATGRWAWAGPCPG